MVSRAIFILLSALAGMVLFLRAENASGAFWLYGFGIGAVTGGLIVVGEYALRTLSFGIIVGATAGLAVGLLMTGLVEWVGGEIFDVQTFLFHIGGLVFLLGFPYLGLVMGARFGQEQFPSFQPRSTDLSGSSHFEKDMKNICSKLQKRYTLITKNNNGSVKCRIYI